jgi:transcriptional regulator of acetoin/glycerol metabolism
VERPGIQQWLKEPRTKSAATQQNGNKGSSHETTATSWKREDNQHDLQKDHQAGDRKASIGDLQRVSENKEMDLVERYTPCETEKEIVYGVRVG